MTISLETSARVPLMRRIESAFQVADRRDRVQECILRLKNRLIANAEQSSDSTVQTCLREVRRFEKVIYDVCATRLNVDHEDPDSDVRHDLTNHDPMLECYAALETAQQGTNRIKKLSNCQRYLVGLLQQRGMRQSRN